MEIPTGYFIDTEELFRIQSEGYNAWSVDEKVVIFFHRVRKIIAIFSLYLYFVKCYIALNTNRYKGLQNLCLSRCCQN